MRQPPFCFYFNLPGTSFFLPPSYPSLISIHQCAMTQNPHDHNFKELIEEFFKNFIEMFWPDKARLIDFETVKFLQQELFTDRTPGKGQDRHIDIIAEVKINHEDKHILIHVEHQSTKESEFPKRMFNYFCHLWLIHQKPIFPIALFSDDSKWSKLIPNHFEIKVLGQNVLRFNFELIKLKDLNWRKYLKSDNPLAVALMSKMGFKKEDRPMVKAEITRLFVTGKIRNHPKSLFLRNFVEFYLDLNPKERSIYKDKVRSFQLKTESEKMILAPVFQKMHDEAIEQGLERGLEQGLEQGLERGLEQGLEQGALKAKLEVVHNLLQQGMDWRFIRKATGITKKHYLKLQKV